MSDVIEIDAEQLTVRQLLILTNISEAKIARALRVPPIAVGYIIKIPGLEEEIKQFLSEGLKIQFTVKIE